MASRIRLVLADDHLLFRQGLKALLEQEAGITVVGETDRVAELSALLVPTAWAMCGCRRAVKLNWRPDCAIRVRTLTGAQINIVA